MTNKVLIAGASGRFGSAAVLAFGQAGWDVRIFDRANETLAHAAAGADVIVNAMNPPDYLDWDRNIPSITKDVIGAAKASGATVIIPGNVYNFGTEPAPWSDATPFRPNSRKGQIRAAMEAEYKASGVKTIVLRAGDFFGPDVSGTWLDLVMLKSVKQGKFVYPGDQNTPHAWAYLPDLAAAAVKLAEIRGSLDVYTDVCFGGHTLTGRDLMEAFEVALGTKLKMQKLPWWPIRLASPFWRMGRELLEMRYLWDHPHWLDGTRLEQLLPEFRGTEFSDIAASLLPVDINPDKAMVGSRRFA